jgi:exosortase B
LDITAPSAKLPATAVDRVAWGLAGATLLVLYVPTLMRLSEKVWSTVEQSYGPIILAASLWLFWQRRERLLAMVSLPAPAVGFAVLAFSLLLYLVGQSQDVLMFATGSALLTLVALLLLYKGWPAVALMSLPLAVLVFVVPLPVEIVAQMTAPLKTGVSIVASDILSWAGYPVARTGVVLMVGPYQLLVADACAGLTSMFTLEAIGVVYMGLRNHLSKARNVSLGLLLVPISFVANVVRVLILVLVTYHFGDEAGQGFVHNAAGILLFMVATVLMLLTDKALDSVPWRQSAASAAT